MKCSDKENFLSIIVPTYNRIESLNRCLDSILNQKVEDRALEYGIIIVLDKRDSETEEWARGKQDLHDSRIKVIRALRKGANAARNRGIEEAKGELIYFLDDDCFLPDQYWINNVYERFKYYKKAAGVGGGYLLKEVDDIYALARNKLDNFYLDSSINKITGETQALLGGNSGYWKNTFIKYGYFDENITYGSAEAEFNVRIIKGGGRLYCADKISVFHKTGKVSIFRYLIKSFKQGAGKAYSVVKNGKLRENISKGGNLWFLTVTKDIKKP